MNNKNHDRKTDILAPDPDAATEENVKSSPDTREHSERFHLPIVPKIIYAIGALCVILYIVFLCSPTVSDFFNRYISPITRVPLAKLTGWIPFSVAEFLLLLVPFIVVFVAWLGIKKYSSSWKKLVSFCLTIISIAAYVFSTFTIGFVPAYRGSTLDQKMGLDKQPVSAEELYSTATIVVNELNELNGAIKYSQSTDFSVMPYGFDELNDKLMEAFETVSEKYDFLQSFTSNVKKIMLSEPMTYTHISGVYTFFTGEANINTNFPDYTLPYTAAHELAHQRGIAREDEANFVAFLVCINSTDDYIRYSGYLNMYEYLAGPLSRADRDYYSRVYYSLPDNVILEMRAYSEFFDKYRENIVEKVSESVNNSFLTINGTQGTISYGLVVDLAVAYYKDN